MPDNYRDRYKRLGFGTESVEIISRTLRSQLHNDQRHERRSSLFCVNRELNQCASNLNKANEEDAASGSKKHEEPAKMDTEETRSKQLEKWRKEMHRRKIFQKKVNKPPFKVGVVRHRLYSPPLTKNPITSPFTKHRKLKENKPAPVPKKNERKINKIQENEKIPLAPKNHKFKAPEGITAMPLFGIRALEAAQQSLLKNCPQIGNTSIASYTSEEGIALNPKSTSTPIPSATSFKNLFKKSTHDGHPQSDFQNETPRKLSRDAIQPWSYLSPFMACSCSDEDSARKELQTLPVNGSSEGVFFQTDLSENFVQEFIQDHPENEVNDLHNAAHESNEAIQNLVRQTSQSTKFLNSLSPFMVSTSDKDCAREESQRSGEQYVQTNCSKQEEYTIQDYKHLLNKETERLTGLCDSWKLVKNCMPMPEDIRCLIQAAVGQTQLLIQNKFKRFGGLVQDCETGEGEIHVTCKDLLGFWELTCIEVEDCDARFKKLEELKANDWIHKETSKAEERGNQKPVVKKASMAKKIAVSRSNSAIKAYIMAARKKMTIKQPAIIIQEVGDDDHVVPALGDPDPAYVQGKIPTIGKDQEARNSEEIQNSSEINMPKIQINEQEKNENAAEVLSLKDVQLDTPVVRTDSDHITPLRSILKSSEGKKCFTKSAKSSKKVRFLRDSKEKPFNDNNNKFLEYVEKDKKTIKRRLNFEENDSYSLKVAKSDINSNNNQSATSPRYLLRSLYYIDTRGIAFEKISPAKEDTTPRSSKLNGKYLKISPGKDEPNLSITPKLKSLRINLIRLEDMEKMNLLSTPQKKKLRVKITPKLKSLRINLIRLEDMEKMNLLSTPQKKKLRIQKLNGSKKKT